MLTNLLSYIDDLRLAWYGVDGDKAEGFLEALDRVEEFILSD